MLPWGACDFKVQRGLYSFGENLNASFKGVFITRACFSGQSLLKLVILPPSRSLGTPEF